jgi:arsenate reductase
MTINVLILGTHNSTRSVLAEAMLNHLASLQQRDLLAYSAGSAPSGSIDPMTLRVLAEAEIDPADYHSKSWDQFSHPDSPEMRIVITIGEGSGKEALPHLPGSPARTHWHYADPSHAGRDEKVKLAAFEDTRKSITARLEKLLALPLESIDHAGLKQALHEIAKD